MSRSLRGDFSSLARLKSNLRAMPLSVAHDVAQTAAPNLTDLTQRDYDSGRTVYGEVRPQGVSGPLTLEATGATRRQLHFTATGTVVRCVLGTKWARYLIGKYSILPNGAMPVEWQKRLSELASASVRSHGASL